MRKKRIYPFVGLIFSLVIVCTSFTAWGEKWRGLGVGLVSPFWEKFYSVKRNLDSSSLLLQEQLAEAVRDTQMLQQQMQQIRQWLLQEDRIEEQLARYRILGEPQESVERRAYFQRRQKELAQILQLQMRSLPARIIYRDPCFWSSFIWINLGSEQNRLLQEDVIAKNSPVVVGNVLVGLVEEVYKKRSKVRLVSDFRLAPSVRVLRKEGPDTALLAKGELHGSGLPLWRARGQKLFGIGFNYDFADEEGLAKNLRGEQQLIQEGDLLVTSGLDGIFPAGLEVASVESVGTLREGECSYQIEAKSLVPNLDALETVSVLPPLD